MLETSKKFQRQTENFVCEKCSFAVEGDGYTNHCLKCLWSKHVDIHPGDRASDCGGLMQPASTELKSGDYIIIHKCKRCGHNKRNKMQKEDDFNQFIKILKHLKKKNKFHNSYKQHTSFIPQVNKFQNRFIFSLN